MAVAKKIAVSATGTGAVRAPRATPVTRALLPLLESVYEGPMETPPFRGFLDALKDALAASSITLMMSPPSHAWNGLMVSAGLKTEEGESSYNGHFFALDPFVGIPEGQVMTPGEFMGEAAWRTSELYLGYLKPLNIYHSLGADLKAETGECRLRISRCRGSAPFSVRDKELVRTLLPHLKRALRLHGRLGSLEGERQLYAGTVDRLLIGTLILDEQGQVIRMNRHARELLAEDEGLRIVGGAPHATIALEEKRLQTLLRDALARCSRKGVTAGPVVAEALALTRLSGGGKLSVLVRAIPEADWREGSRRPRVAVFLRNTEEPVPASQESLIRLFGLTSGEAVVALLLADGLNLDEAAAQLGISRNTARAHLRAIYAKTGITRQAGLVRLLLNSVAALS